MFCPAETIRKSPTKTLENILKEKQIYFKILTFPSLFIIKWATLKIQLHVMMQTIVFHHIRILSQNSRNRTGRILIITITITLRAMFAFHF